MKVEYSSNNSGGSFWLSDQNWRDLEAAGWTVEWCKERWLGTLATRASREGLTLGAAIAEWEDVTGENSSDLGCSCCGTPHSFHFEGDNGESEWYSPSYPSSGDRYGDW